MYQMYVDDNGRSYFVNDESGETRWDSPDGPASSTGSPAGGGGRSPVERVASMRSDGGDSMDADFDDLPPESLSRAVAIADFEEASPDQLSFSEGDQLVVQVRSGWI